MAVINQINGKGIPLNGDDVDTDQIVPARFLKEITFEKMGDYLFYDLRYKSSKPVQDFPLNQPCYKDGTILIVGRNFGCGSSREHAPQAIKRYGIKAIIGISFAEIFSGNCLALGVPTVCLPADTIASLQLRIEQNPDLPLILDLFLKTLKIDNEKIPIDIKNSQRDAFLQGSWDVINILKGNLAAIEEKDRDLPHYIS